MYQKAELPEPWGRRMADVRQVPANVVKMGSGAIIRRGVIRWSKRLSPATRREKILALAPQQKKVLGGK